MTEELYLWLKENAEAFGALKLMSASLRDGVNILSPAGGSGVYGEPDIKTYTDGKKLYTFLPKEPFYVDFDVICYRSVYEDNSSKNMRQLAQLEKIGAWFTAQQNSGNLPKIKDCEVYALECLTPFPFVRNEYEDIHTHKIIIDYAVSIRLYCKNPAKEKRVIV